MPITRTKKKPKIEILGKNTFCVTFYSRLYKEKKQTTQETTPKTTHELLFMLNENQIKILEIINENPSITQKEISKKLKISRDGVKYNMNILREMNIITREGATKNGYWKIL